MNTINIKDLVLYFITANVFFFMSLHSDNEMAVLPLGLVLLGLIFLYLIRSNRRIEM